MTEPSEQAYRLWSWIADECVAPNAQMDDEGAARLIDAALIEARREMKAIAGEESQFANKCRREASRQGERAVLAEAEVERLRAEVDRLCEAVYERADNCLRAEWERDAARAEVGQLTRERDEARQECTCPWVDPKYWTTHYGAIEPGSTQEYDPTCPKHGALVDKVERLQERVDSLREKVGIEVRAREQWEANAERAEAALARVEALADKWEAIPYDKRTPYDEGWHDALDTCETELRAALDDPDGGAAMTSGGAGRDVVLYGWSEPGVKVTLSRTPRRIALGGVILHRVDDPEAGEFLGCYITQEVSDGE